ncbi:MAG: fumarate hydratase [Sphaerochaetaceae bacterium]
MTTVELAVKISDAIIYASQNLEESLVKRLNEFKEHYKGDDTPNSKASYQLLKAIDETLKLSIKHNLPMCQDTGLTIAFIEYGQESRYSMAEIEKAFNKALEIALDRGNMRASIVKEPLYERQNSKTNSPAVIYWIPKEGREVTINFLLKGFGSENCSSLVMLNPTSTEDELIETIVKSVKAAGSKPCPPIVVGVGLGGSSDRAMYLSKIALLRSVGERHPETRYANLEKKIETAINELQIGPGGFKGDLTALGVAIEYEPTHIAGLPLGITISCWADRKGKVVLK